MTIAEREQQILRIKNALVSRSFRHKHLLFDCEIASGEKLKTLTFVQVRS